ncbi:beta strand repeat-containing protein, partial [Azospirillum oleiclasticum]
TGTGNALDNVITGGAGADTLDGGLGADTLVGGLGDDVYLVDDAGDVVVELAGEGADAVHTTLATYTLGDHVEALTHTGSASFTGTGNAQDNVITGGAGADTLDGGLGADTLTGGLGDDVYLVDDTGDVVVEQAGGGTDEVRTALAALTLADAVERLTYTGSASFSGTGNALNNVITGGAGADTLSGGAGADTLDGGLGADTLVGGLGNDLYLVDDAGDVVVELAGEGVDAVHTTLAAHTLADHVEGLTYTGSGDFAGTGNALDNTITGGAGVDTLAGLDGNDTLDGGLGADTLTGGLGDDTYVVDDAADLLVEQPGEGTDTVRSAVSWTLAAGFEALTLTGTAATGTGNAADNVITGNASANLLTGLDGADTLDGGAGADTLTGGLGDDTYVVDSPADQVVEAVGEGTDTVRSGVSWTLGANLERLVLTGSGSIVGTGNELDNVITGNGGNNTLDGGLGDDTLIGNAGNDIFIVDSLGDVVTEAANQGSDEVRTALAAWTLGANLERLVFTGTGSFAGTGNELANTLTGQAGDDTLSGLGGNDTLTGGAGADTLDGGLGTDTASYAGAAAGVAVDLTAGTASGGDATGDVLTGIENLTGGNGADALTGDAGVNVLNGNAGADTLTGLDGNDTLIGGAGADALDGGLGTDTASYATSGASVAVDLADGGGTAGDAAGDTLTGIENLTGGNGADTLLGDGGANRIDGGAGNDTLQGRGGNDSLVGGSGTDTAVYLGSVRDYVATKTGTTWTIAAPAATGEGTDTLTGVEYAQFSNMLVHLDHNNAPVVPGGLTASTNEDAAPLSVNLLAGVWDFENDALSVTGLTQTVGAPVTVSLAGGVLTLDPAQLDFLAAGETADLTFDFGVSDGTDSTARSLTVTVAGRNDAPVLTGPLTVTTNEDAGPLLVDLLQGASDPDTSDTLSVTGVTRTGGRAVSFSSTGGVLTLDPGQFNDLGVGESETVTFGYSIGDGAASVVQTLAVTVQGRNDAPVAGADAIVAVSGIQAVIDEATLLTNDEDADQTATLSISDVGDAVHGTVGRDNQGNILFTPEAGFSGTASFRYTVMDEHGATSDTTVLVDIVLSTPVGPAIVAGTTRKVNATVANVDMQGPAALAVLSDGSYVVAYGRKSDGSGTGVSAQRFTADGTAVGGVITIPSNTTNNQIRPSLTALSDGGFLATWDTFQDGLTWNIFQQRFDNEGNKVGDPARVNSTIARQQNFSDVTALTGGGWVVNWWSEEQDGDSWGVYQQRYAANGTKLGSEEQVNTQTTNAQYQQHSTALADGGWVVSWTSLHAGGNADVYQQRFSNQGARVGGEVRVNMVTLDGQSNSSITALADGGWVVVWQSQGQDGSGVGVYGRVFDADGSARTDERWLGDMACGDQFLPDVTGLADGGFVAVWTSGSATGTYGGEIRARRFDAEAVALGDDFRIDDMGVPLAFPVVAARPDGGFVTAWMNTNGSSSATQDNVNVYTRVFAADGVPLGRYDGTTGDDTLFGSSGQDTLTGGAGADAFLITDPTVGTDTITDFQTGIDRIEVVGTAFGSLPVGTLDPERFALNAAADADDRFVFDTTTRILSYDADGSGIGAAVSLAYLAAGTITAADIRVVS